MLSNRGTTFNVDKRQSTIFPSFNKPRIIGYWSLDRNRQLHWDSSQLRYYTPFKQPNVEYDLKEGSSIFEAKPNCLDDEKMEHILRWIERNYEKILDNSESKKWLQADFILYRGMLAKIIKAPYNTSQGWIICAAKLNGTIYLCQFDNDEKKHWMAAKEQTREIWPMGFKFEQYMLTETPGGIPDTSKALNESEDFCCVYQSRLNNHSLVYAAEMDGLCSDKKFEDPLPLDELIFVELKLRHPLCKREVISKWNKWVSLHWWAQNYIIGVENIVCGERDYEDGIVRRLEKLRVSDLKIESKGHWNAAICMNFGDEFLKFVKNIVKNDYDETIYKFEKECYSGIVVTEEEPTSEYAFLPDWYIELSNNEYISSNNR